MNMYNFDKFICSFYYDYLLFSSLIIMANSKNNSFISFIPFIIPCIYFSSIIALARILV